MTFLDALLVVPAAVTSPAAVAIYGAILIAVAILVAISEMHNVATYGFSRVTAIAAAGFIVALWVGIALIAWAISSGSGTEWVAP